MRIGIFCNTFGRSGGMETYALNLIQACLNLGHIPVVFCKKADHSLPFAKQCEIHEYPNHILPNKIYFWLFHRWLTEIRKKVIVDFSIGCCLGGFPEIIACGGTRLGYLRSMHKPIMFWDRMIIELEKKTYHSAKYVIAHAIKMENELTQLYSINQSKIKVIYPPINIPNTSLVRDLNIIKEKYNIPKNRTIYLFPSLSHKRKGYPLLHKYFSSSPNGEILIVAGKPIISDSENIISLGFCKNMSELYQISDYTILASLYEPLALVAIESVWNGTPVVMAEDIGCHEVISSEAIRSFNPNSYDSLATCLGNLHSHPLSKLSLPYQQYIKYPVEQTSEEHLQEIINLFSDKLS